VWKAVAESYSAGRNPRWKGFPQSSRRKNEAGQEDEVIPLWEKQLILLQNEFKAEAKSGYFIGLALASGFADSPSPDGTSAEVVEGERRHIAFEKVAAEDRRVITRGLLDDDSMCDATGKVLYKPTGPFGNPWERTRIKPLEWAPAKSFSWCGIWGDAAGVQKFTALATSAAMVLPSDLWGCDEPLFCPPVPAETRRWSADPLSRWGQFLFVWSFQSFTRIVFGSNPDILFTRLSADAFLTSALTIEAIVGQKQIPLVKRYKRQFRDVQWLLYGEERVEDSEKTGRPKNLDAWRRTALGLLDSCKPNGRIDYKKLIKLVRADCLAGGIVISPDDPLNIESLRGFVNNSRQWSTSSH